MVGYEALYIGDQADRRLAPQSVGCDHQPDCRYAVERLQEPRVRAGGARHVQLVEDLGDRPGRIRGLWASEPVRSVSVASASTLRRLRLLWGLRPRGRNRIRIDGFVGQAAIQADLFQGSEPPP